jgi:hypothetical protein
MIKVDQVTALSAELLVNLVSYPRRSITYGV